MFSRRHGRPLLLTLLVTGALALGACSGGDGDPAGASSSAATATDLAGVTVEDGEAGAEDAAAVPTVTVPAPLSVAQTESKVLTQGNGEAIEAGDVVSIDFVGLNGATGKQFGASGWNGKPVSLVLGDGVIAGFRKALTGVEEGSRVLTAVSPDDGFGPQGGVEGAGIGADDTLVYLIDVISVSPGWATGAAVTPPPGLPTVALDPTTHAPTITVDTSADPPSELVAQSLVQGTGPATTAGQTLTVQYTGVTWSTGEAFDSSWDKGTPLDFQLGAGNVIKGWDQGLAGVAVGSQVLLVIPPDLAYGDDDDKGEAIPPGSTLVFVVDVLSAQ